MKKAILVIIALLALLLGTTTSSMFTGPDNARLRFTESFVCPDGSRYRFTTRSVPFFDPQTSMETTGTQLTVDCVENDRVTRANVTAQAQGLFSLAAVGSWFVGFIVLWLLIAVRGWLRPRTLTPAPQPITLAAADQEHLLALLRAGHKIEAVKHVQTITGRSLADAKAHVEEIESTVRQ